MHRLDGIGDFPPTQVVYDVSMVFTSLQHALEARNGFWEIYREFERHFADASGNHEYHFEKFAEAIGHETRQRASGADGPESVGDDSGRNRS